MNDQESKSILNPTISDPTAALTQGQAIGINQYREVLNAGLLHWGVPRHMWDAIIAYVMTGRPLPDFLYAVFSNNLREAVMKADDLNRDRLREYINFLMSTVPVHCWNSEVAVRNWGKIGGIIGQTMRHGAAVNKGGPSPRVPAAPRDPSAD
jgi:hypothetical protein